MAMGGAIILTPPQRRLVLSALALIAVMFVLAPVLTTWLGPAQGYVAIFALYWLGFCLPVILIFIARQDWPSLLSFRIGRGHFWVPVVVAMQAIGVGFAAFDPDTGRLTAQGIAISAGLAITNGVLEEAAWRGGFFTQFKDNRRLGFIVSLGLFGLWHVPVALALAPHSPDGALYLLLGAVGFGAAWTAMTWRTGSIAWSVVGHVFINFLTFSALLFAGTFL